MGSKQPRRHFNNAHLLENPHEPPKPSQEQLNAAMAQAVGQLSQLMYSRLATEYIASCESHTPVNQDHLRQLVEDSQTAAKAYFEATHGIKFEDEG